MFLSELELHLQTKTNLRYKLRSGDQSKSLIFTIPFFICEDFGTTPDIFQDNLTDEQDTLKNDLNQAATSTFLLVN